VIGVSVFLVEVGVLDSRSHLRRVWSVDAVYRIFESSIDHWTEVTGPVWDARVEIGVFSGMRVAPLRFFDAGASEVSRMSDVGFEDQM